MKSPSKKPNLIFTEDQKIENDQVVFHRLQNGKIIMSVFPSAYGLLGKIGFHTDSLWTFNQMVQMLSETDAWKSAEKFARVTLTTSKYLNCKKTKKIWFNKKVFLFFKFLIQLKWFLK